ncbi:MAG: DinB family protein [Phycisphaeraceae bacterium]|nr:DinB family protein [Phycisphaeraceae bacterium]
MSEGTVEGQGGGCCGGKTGSSGGQSAGGCGCQTTSQKLVIPTGTAKEIVALPIPEMLSRFRRGVGNYDPRVFSLDAEQMDRAFLPDAKVGRWSVRMLLGHMADAEIVFVHRMRRAVAEDRPLLAVWDENAFIDSGLYAMPREVQQGDPASLIGGYVAVLHTMRMWSFQWLSGLSPEQFERVAMHPERGEQRVRDILSYAIWHVEHHSRFLQLKCDRMLGPVEEPVAAGAGTSGGCCGGR